MCSGNPVEKVIDEASNGLNDLGKSVADAANDVGTRISDVSHEAGTYVADTAQEVGQGTGDFLQHIYDQTPNGMIQDSIYKVSNDMHNQQTLINSQSDADNNGDADQSFNHQNITDAEIKRRRALAAMRRGFLSTVKTSGSGLMGKPLLGVPALASGYKARLGA